MTMLQQCLLLSCDVVEGNRGLTNSVQEVRPHNEIPLLATGTFPFQGII